MARKVLVLGEIRDDSLRNVSFEAVAAAKKNGRRWRSHWSFDWQ